MQRSLWVFFFLASLLVPALTHLLLFTPLPASVFSAFLSPLSPLPCGHSVSYLFTLLSLSSHVIPLFCTCSVFPSSFSIHRHMHCPLQHQQLCASYQRATPMCMRPHVFVNLHLSLESTPSQAMEASLHRNLVRNCSCDDRLSRCHYSVFLFFCFVRTIQ